MRCGVEERGSMTRDGRRRSGPREGMTWVAAAQVEKEPRGREDDVTR
jgi:hypothetical protein